MYVDGALAASGSGNGTAGENFGQMGFQGANTGINSLSGILDELRIRTRRRTADWIATSTGIITVPGHSTRRPEQRARRAGTSSCAGIQPAGRNVQQRPKCLHHHLDRRRKHSLHHRRQHPDLHLEPSTAARLLRTAPGPSRPSPMQRG